MNLGSKVINEYKHTYTLESNANVSLQLLLLLLWWSLMILFIFHSLILEVEKWKKKGALEALPFHHFENGKKKQWDFHSCKLTRHSCYERAPQVACLLKEEERVGFHSRVQ
jgi:hypothetical protein